jgi:D-xylose transport system substrate-binding protein
MSSVYRGHKMKNKINAAWFVAMIIVSAVSVFTGCSGRENTQEVQTDESDPDAGKVKIGISFDSFVIERWQQDRDIFVSSATENGAIVNVQTANGDAQKQIQDIDYFIKQKEDVIVIIPVDRSSLGESVEKAHRAGIKVIAYDRLMTDSRPDLYISFDNSAVGQFMAEVINSSLPDGGNCIKINGPHEDYNVTLVNEGFDTTINRNINIIDETECSGWVGEEAFDFLDGHPEEVSKADAIMCGNDSLAGQVVTLLAERRLAGKVIVTGQDADLEACQRVVEGTQTMTVYKPIGQLARTAAQDAIILAKGGDVPDVETISNGKYDIPYVRITPQKVTKDSIDSVIIDSGFHLKEDVYMNSKSEN